jgi:hypothetical protein
MLLRVALKCHHRSRFRSAAAFCTNIARKVARWSIANARQHSKMDVRGCLRRAVQPLKSLKYLSTIPPIVTRIASILTSPDCTLGIYREAGRIVQAEQLKINSQTCWVCSEIRIFFCVVSRSRRAAVTTPNLDPKINLGCFKYNENLFDITLYYNIIDLNNCFENK